MLDEVDEEFVLNLQWTNPVNSMQLQSRLSRLQPASQLENHLNPSSRISTYRWANRAPQRGTGTPHPILRSSGSTQLEVQQPDTQPAKVVWVGNIPKYEPRVAEPVSRGCCRGFGLNRAC
jgi:hypothetical protein